MRTRGAILCVALFAAVSVASATLAPFNGRLTNFSARGAVGTGDDTLILGCVLDGGSRQPLMFRGVGPTLAQFNVPNPVAATTLSVYLPGATQPQSFNVADVTATITALRVGAFELPVGSRDSAAVLTSDRGNYTIHLNGANGA